MRACPRTLDSALIPENLIPLDVPQKASVISMSEMAITTMLARMARPAARPTCSGPPLHGVAVVAVRDRDEDDEHPDLGHGEEDVARRQEGVEVVGVGAAALVGDEDDRDLRGQVGARQRDQVERRDDHQRRDRVGW